MVRNSSWIHRDNVNRDDVEHHGDDDGYDDACDDDSCACDGDDCCHCHCYRYVVMVLIARRMKLMRQLNDPFVMMVNNNCCHSNDQCTMFVPLKMVDYIHQT